MWQFIGKWAVKIAIYSIGHQDLIIHTIADAKAKNLNATLNDVGSIIATAQSDAQATNATH